MNKLAADEQIRLAAFTYLDQQKRLWGDALPFQVLREGFEFQGQRVPLSGPQGIFKPAAMELPLTIMTAPEKRGQPRPYEDEWVSDELLRYRYRGTDPGHPENVGLRRAMEERLPLIYLDGIEPGRYASIYPVFIIGDDPESLSFIVADQTDQLTRPGVVGESLERRYVERLTRQRLHQVAFRHRVITAYRESCAICRLRHRELLDAAHIIRDVHELGRPAVHNGLALCKLHHAAFDGNIVGVRPDLIIELRADVLAEIDGPMLVHGLQGFQGASLHVPRQEDWRPRPDYLEQRYEEFRQAG